MTAAATAPGPVVLPFLKVVRPPAPRRRPPPAAPPNRLAFDELSPAVRAAVLSLEWPECGCNLSLLSSCLLGLEPGCRQRRRCGMCECRRRELPQCLTQRPHGCRRRQLGKRCKCAEVPLPECLANGCDRRRRGRLCDCPRTPSTTCRHMGHAARMRILAGFLTFVRLCEGTGLDPYDLWAFALWAARPKVYADRELPGAPADMSDREESVARMELRHALGVGLRHPEDEHGVAGEAEAARLGLQLRKFANLIQPRKEAGRGGKAA